MNSRLLTAFLVVAALAQGCIVHNNNSNNNNPPPNHVLQPGDVTITWRFAGTAGTGACSDAPGVKGVHITIPGENLENNGFYPCLVANYPGVVLHNFAGGSYSYTIEALGYDDRVLFEGASTFVVDGSVRSDIDLTPAGGPTSYAYIAWTFPGGDSCQTAGITTVDAIIDGIATSYDCSAGQVQPGVFSPYLNPGTHNIQLVGRTNTGYPIYQLTSTLQTVSGQALAASYGMQWAVGGAAISWSLFEGSVQVTCAQTGINTMYVNFKNTATGKWVYADVNNNPVDDAQPCVPASGAVTYNILQPGNYQVWLGGTGTGGNKYVQDNGPVVNVQAGVFVNASQALTVAVPRVQ